MSVDYVVPTDYGCVALLSPDKYQSYVSEEWTLEGLLEHFVRESNLCRIFAWGTVCGNWKVRVTGEPVGEHGCREATGVIESGGQLLLTSYDSLTMAAQYQDVKLPEEDADPNLFKWPAGIFKARVIQMFDPAKAESEEVFNQVEPHYLLELMPASEGDKEDISEVAWFAEVNHL